MKKNERKRNGFAGGKRLAALALAGLTALGLGACSAGSSYTGNSTANPNAYELTKGAVRTNFVTADMMASADLWLDQDDTAVADVMRRAEAGESITIAVIGGSITEGTISTGTLDSKVVGAKSSYANIFFEWWTAMFPEADLQFVNAGIGGTDSYLGLHRVTEDVLSYEPDLVLVEYAVNDASTDFYQTCYDNLVRTILTDECSPAVILYFFGQTNGSTAQGKQSAIGLAYGLPMFSYYNVIRDLMADETYTAAELSGDTVHPSALGHAIAGEILWHYLNEVYANRERYGKVGTFACEAVTEEKYTDATILDSDDVTPDTLGTFTQAKVTDYFPIGWQTTAGEGGITFTTTFKNLGILYQKTVDGLSGRFEVYVDGTWAGTINADFTDGWGNAIEGTEVYTSETAAAHTVTIRKAADSEGEKFNLLGLLVSQ